MIFDSRGNGMAVEHLYTVEDYFTLNIKIKSGEFAGASNFCMPREAITSIVENLSIMDTDLKGVCEIRDYDSDSNVKIEMDKYGHMFLCGQIGGSHEEHFMRFKYLADQTMLKEFIRIFKSLM